VRTFVLVVGFPAGLTETNCWVVAAAAGEQCVVVDPGVGADHLLEQVLDEHRLHPVAVLLTHGHWDHTFSVVPVCAARGLPAFVHPADRGQLTDPWTATLLPPGTPLFGRLTWAEPAGVRALADGELLELAGLSLQVAHAPGHTPGSVTFRTGAEFFAGDLLFAGSIGRVDLPGGDAEQMLASLARVCLPLPDDTLVRPGHGPETTIGRERRTNPFLLEVAALSAGR
jgi:hydroxyacylglutathione hydrolase